MAHVLTAKEIRSQFIRFFEERGHRFVPSSPVVPNDDPTLLFTNAGMNQFKPIFLGTEKRDYTRAANSQKCIRVSGKHNDLEEVGHDTYHHTFFEMLGNWSFGDYYKAEAIQWAWELFTKQWGLPKDRLYATVYKTDDEAVETWKKVTDINPDHILRFGEKDNFWEMGDTGPCGPCSEIHIDLTPDGNGGKLVNAGSPEVIELWNLVFIQFNRNADRSLTELPAKHVDTGAGFERVARVLQGKTSNYDIDLFTDIISGIEKVAGKNYAESAIQAPFRVIADHIRMLTFSITDGAIPGNDGRGYVLRRILRRAALYGRKLELHEPFIYKLVTNVVGAMGDAFPEIRARQEFVERVIKTEEENFNKTLDRGIEVFEDMACKLESKGIKQIPGADVFKLYDTFGFPADMTRVMAAERGLSVDEDKFTEEMKAQKQRSRDEGKKIFINKEIKWETIGSEVKTKFIGYDVLESQAKPLKYFRDGKLIQMVFDQTPFYAESGGQVGDKGTVTIGNHVFEIWDTQRVGDDVVHFADDFENFSLSSAASAQLSVSKDHREPTIKNHSATHLLHSALRSVLGEHVHQSGSVVEPYRLRFDFSHFEKITDDQLKKIETMVQERVFENIALQHHRNIPIADAKKMGALSFFGDKYGEFVNVVQFGEYSKEFCGGTHVPSTGKIGFFKIVSESSIASGVRRIEAITGSVAEGLFQNQYALQESLRHTLNCKPEEISERIESLINDRKLLEKELSDLRLQSVTNQLDGLMASAVMVNGFKVITRKITLPSGTELRAVGDQLREKLASGVGVLATQDTILCVVSDDLIRDKKLHAGNLVKAIAQIAGGSGGGRPHSATAGIKDISKLDAALAKVNELVSM
ncbi:MAG TPA: alanine--tRNA ligase [bacterium]|nr:alanine--tRNA ligase [bacterium]